jgi:hypothetical protein
MPSQNALGLQIDHEHCRAICDEIADRLRIILNREVKELPPHLLILLNRLAESEREPAPSIVPSADDMGFWPTVPTHIETRSHRPDGPKRATVTLVSWPKSRDLRAQPVR